MTSRCRRPLKFYEQPSLRHFDRQDMEKEVAAEKEDQQLDCTSAREQPLVSLGDCTDLQSGAELCFDCESTFLACIYKVLRV